MQFCKLQFLNMMQEIRVEAKGTIMTKDKIMWVSFNKRNQLWTLEALESIVSKSRLQVIKSEHCVERVTTLTNKSSKNTCIFPIESKPQQSKKKTFYWNAKALVLLQTSACIQRSQKEAPKVVSSLSKRFEAEVGANLR